LSQEDDEEAVPQHHEDEKGLFDDDSELEEMSPAKSRSSSPKRRKVGFNSTGPSPNKFTSPLRNENDDDEEDSPAKGFSDFAVPKLGHAGFGL
jgi:hypothetical protein